MKHQNLNYYIIGILIFLFIIPTFLYIYKFGFGFWQPHYKWAEMGNYFSGIYYPILALLTIIVLGYQVSLIEKSNRFAEDMTLISQTTSKLDFYTKELSSRKNILDKVSNTFYEMSKDQIEEINQSDLLLDLYNGQDFQTALSLWTIINEYCTSLDNGDYPYKHNLNDAIFRIQYELSHKTCVSLDKMLSSLHKHGSEKKLFYLEMEKI